MKTLVLGYGKSGAAAERLLGAAGDEVTVLDGSVPFPDGAFDRAIVSPGIALTHPWLAACRAKGIPFESELALGCRELKRRGWQLLAVTGSKGKSSVVKIVADAITQAGGRAVPCGNYGTPVCEVAASPQPQPSPSTCLWAVVEVSSFMMETTDLPPETFAAAVILNLQEDHLDRHGSVAVYHGLKRKLLDFATVGLDFSAGGEMAGCVPMLNLGETLRGSYFDNPVLETNGAAAIFLMGVAGLDEAAIRAAFAAFRPLPHRMNLVAELGGVRYIDDSKATSLAALAAGVVMAAGKVRLIAGGLPKGDDPKSVLPVLTERVKKVYLIGQCAEAFAKAWEGSVECEISGTMDRAVAAAMREAAKGEVVLLSPGTASFDQFKSFGERGEVFARLVNKGK